MTKDELQIAYNQQKQEINLLKQQIDQLLKLINGFKSERLISSVVSEQPTLFDLEENTTTTPTETEQVSYTRSKKKHPGRHKLPEHLPVKEIIIEPDQSVEGLVKIGEEISETLEYTPASLVKRRTIRPKYAKANGEGIVIGELPSRPMDM